MDGATKNYPSNSGKEYFGYCTYKKNCKQKIILYSASYIDTAVL